MLALQCPKCAKLTHVQGVTAGALINCLACGHPIQVPGGEPSKPTERAGPPRHKRRTWALALIGFGSAVFIGTLLFINFASRSPLSSYAVLIPDDCQSVLHLDLQVLRATTGIDAEQASLNKELLKSLGGLGLAPGDASLASLLVVRRADDTLFVWTFDRPVRLDPHKTRIGYERGTAGAHELWIDRVDPTRCWAVDGQGRALSGAPAAVSEALTRIESRSRSAAAIRLSNLTEELPSSTALWLACDFSRSAGKLPKVFPVALDPLRDARIDSLLAFVHETPAKELTLKAKAKFPSGSDAKAFLDFHSAAKNNDQLFQAAALPLIPTNHLQTAFAASRVQERDTEVTFETPVSTALARSFLDNAAKAQAQANASRVEQLQALVETFVGQARQALRDEKYDAAVELLDKAAAVGLGGKTVADLQAQARSDWEKLKRFSAETSLVEKSLQAGDVAKAGAHLEAAASLRPEDPALAGLHRRVKTAQDDLTFASLRDAGEAALLAGDIAKAKRLYQEGLKLRPQDDGMIGRLGRIQGLEKVDSLLAAAQAKLDQGDPDGAFQASLAVKPFFETDWARLSIDKTFQAGARRLRDRAEQLFVAVVEHHRNAAAAERKRADAAFAAKDYDLANKESGLAIKVLANAQRRVTDYFDTFPTQVIAALKQTQRDVAADVAALELLQRRAIGQTVLGKALQRVAEARKMSAAARMDTALLLKAERLFEEGLKTLEEAKQFPDTNADAQIKAAGDELSQVRRLMTPFDVEFSRVPDDWTIEPDLWKAHQSDKGLTWLQAKSDRVATLRTPEQPWPPEYDFDAVFFVANASGDIVNAAVGYYPDQVFIRFMKKGPAGVNLMVAFGKDPDVRFENIPSVMVGAKRHSLRSIVKLNEPITLRIENRHGALSIFVNGKLVAKHTAKGEFDQVAFSILNPRTPEGQAAAFPALVRTGLKIPALSAPATDKKDDMK